jgi:hypothetical protein
MRALKFRGWLVESDSDRLYKMGIIDPEIKVYVQITCSNAREFHWLLNKVKSYVGDHDYSNNLHRIYGNSYKIFGSFEINRTLAERLAGELGTKLEPSVIQRGAFTLKMNNSDFGRGVDESREEEEEDRMYKMGLIDPEITVYLDVNCSNARDFYGIVTTCQAYVGEDYYNETVHRSYENNWYKMYGSFEIKRTWAERLAGELGTELEPSELQKGAFRLKLDDSDSGRGVDESREEEPEERLGRMGLIEEPEVTVEVRLISNSHEELERMISLFSKIDKRNHLYKSKREGATVPSIRFVAIGKKSQLKRIARELGTEIMVDQRFNGQQLVIRAERII